jgi:voltage-gated potassium channel
MNIHSPVKRVDWRAPVRSVLDGVHPRYGRAFEFFIAALIVLSMISITLESMPDLSDQARLFLDWEEVLVVAVFTVEYALRAATAEQPFGYVFSFWGFIDLVAIAPFYLGLGADFRSARAFRLLRMFRAMKLLRYNSAAVRLRTAFLKVREELLVFGVIALITLFVSAVGIYYFEHDAQPNVFASIPVSLWWSALTLTTIGDGDAYPITVGGRIFTVFVLMLGLGIVAIPTGLIASALTEIRREERERLKSEVMSVEFDPQIVAERPATPECSVNES